MICKRLAARTFCNVAADVNEAAKNTARVVSFDLPVKIDSTRISERERQRKKHLDKTVGTGTTSSQTSHALDQYFPTKTLAPQPEDLPDIVPVKVPHLWIDPKAKTSVSDIGRFERYSRDDLMELLPEGLAGELSRDIFLMPSRTRDIGIMYRKATHEIINQLDSTSRSSDCIPKSGWLLEGKRGTGKSSIMNSVVAWARKQGNWIVIFEPLGSRFGKEIAEITRSSTGVYIQNELAKEFIERFLQANKSLLGELQVAQEYYGRIGIDAAQLETIERVYLPLIEKSIEHSLLPERLEEISRLRSSLIIPSLKSKMHAPNTVLEIAEFAIENSTYATQALGEIINQLKVQNKFPVLVAIDEWNEMFVVSEYVSTRYDNTIFNGYIPSYHLSVPRLLSRWDGAEWKRGVKLFSTSWSKRNRRQFNPELLGVRPEEIKQVRGFTKDEFMHFAAYQALTNTSHRFPSSKLDYFYMLTQGNGFEARRIMATLY